MSENKKETLKKRTIQIIGFGSSLLLFSIKIILAILELPATDTIPWYVIMGAFGVGVSADFDITRLIGKK